MRGMMRSFCAAVLLFSGSGVGSVQAQPRVHDLGEAEARFPEGFAMVRTVRELSDGRVMVADPLGQLVLALDLETGTADTLGGVGQGPSEYRQPDAVFALPGDSTLLLDLGNARLVVIGPDGTFGQTMPIAQGEPRPGGGLLIVLPRGVDSRGRVYFRPLGGGMRGEFPDSASVVRLERNDGTLDTVAKVKLPEMKRRTSGGAGSENVRVQPIPLSPEDAWAVGRDGRVAIARVDGYRLEWVHPDGRVVRGAPVTYEPVGIGSRDKEAWLDDMANGLSVSIMVNNGERRMTFGRGGSNSRPDPDDFEWPEFKPPFDDGGVYVSPTGEAWVRRHVPAGAPVIFDVFDERAELRRQVRLPAGRELVGFGDESVYAVFTDELGLQWLERYRRPTT